MAIGTADQVIFRPTEGGNFSGPMVQAYRTGDIIYQQPRAARSENALAAFSGAAVVFLAIAVSSGVPARWAVAVCLPLGVVLGVVFVRRRRRRRLVVRLSSGTLRRAAESLAEALALQYARDEAHIRVDDPAPLPVRWAPAPPGIGDHPMNLVGGEGHLPQLDGSFSAVVRTYESLAHGRLIVLGAPGAGKSVLVLRLATALLRQRADDSPVPVVFPLSSWDPREGTPLWWWAAGMLADSHPEALAEGDTSTAARTVAHQLITSGRILPILDGFDELPAPAWPQALAQLRNSLLLAGRFVLTSRTTAFTDVVTTADVRVPRTAAVELQPLSMSDVSRHLPLTSRPQGDGTTKWDPVLAQLTGPRPPHSDGDEAAAHLLRDVLATPLMVSMARTAYSDTTADPAELVQRDRFATRNELERHLLSAYVDAVYQPDAAAVPDRGGSWTPVQARRYLAWLARGQWQDIAWWRLEQAVPRAFRIWVMSFPLALILAVAVAVTGLPAPWEASVPDFGLWTGIFVLLGALAAGTADWVLADPDRMLPPQRLRRPLGMVVQALRLRPWRTVVRTVVVLLLLSSVIGLWTTAAALGSGTGMFWASYWALLVVMSVVVRTRAAVRTPADPDARDPLALLREDRRTTLALLPFSCSPGPARLSAHKVMSVGVFATVLIWGLGRGQDAMAPWRWLTTACALILWWCLWNCAVSSWGRYTLARWWLASTGRLPRQLTEFLTDAHRRGVLRQTGGVFRFRHVELQRKFAEDPESQGRDRYVPSAFLRRRVGKVRQGLAASVSLAASGASVLSLCAALLAGPGAMGPLRSLGSACELLPLKSLRPLAHDPTSVGRPRIESVFTVNHAANYLEQPHYGEPRLHARSSCVYAEQAALRPDVEVTVTVGLAAGEGAANSAEQAQQAVEYPQLLNTQVRQSGGTWSMASGVNEVPSPDLAADAKRQIPLGWARARIGNALVAVDVALEFGTKRHARQAAEALTREVLDRIRRTYHLSGSPVPTGTPLTRIPRAGVSEDSRFGIYHEGRTGRLAGAVWRESDPARIEQFSRMVAFRVPRDADCEQPAETDLMGAEDGLLCTGRLAGGSFRAELAFTDCGASCSEQERRAFVALRPGKPLDTWDHHEPVDYDRSPGTAHLLWSAPVTRTVGEGKPTHVRILLWLRVSAPPTQQELADKVLNDLWGQASGQ